MASQKGRGAQGGGFVIVQKHRGAVRGATDWLQEAREALRVANDCLLGSHGRHLSATVTAWGVVAAGRRLVEVGFQESEVTDWLVEVGFQESEVDERLSGLDFRNPRPPNGSSGVDSENRRRQTGPLPPIREIPHYRAPTAPALRA